MQTSKIVTEVVEIPLGVPFAEFLRIFQLALLPVLLAEPGVLSVRTGKRTRDFPIPLQLLSHGVAFFRTPTYHLPQSPNPRQ